MAPLRRFDHKGTVSYISGPVSPSVSSEAIDAQEDDFSIVVAQEQGHRTQGGGGSHEPEETIDAILYEIEDSSGQVVKYRVRFDDGGIYDLTATALQSFHNGQKSLDSFQAQLEESGQASSDVTSDNEDENDDIIALSESEREEDSDEELQADTRTRTRGVKRQRASGFTDFSNVDLGDDSEDELAKPNAFKRLRRGPRRGSTIISSRLQFQDDGTSSESEPKTRSRNRKSQLRSSGRVTRNAVRGQEPEYIGLVDESSDESEDDDLVFLESDILPKERRRSVVARGRSKGRQVSLPTHKKQGTRHSGRATRNQANMQEIGEDDVFRESEDDRPVKPRISVTKESFKTLPANSKFVARHCQQCETCGRFGSGPGGQLVHCQGCSLSYHKQCLGNRTTRDHLVTKVGEDEFVLQCRRCVNQARRKEATAPDQGMCQSCREIGPACHPLRDRKTSAQEQRERLENGGEDPIVEVDGDLLNNSNNILFRCLSCWRAYHYHHLPPKSDEVMDYYHDDDEQLADQRFQQYKREWYCVECSNMAAQKNKVSGLIAWRPVDQDLYVAGMTTDQMNEDDKEYLIKWDQKSYFRSQWMSGAWTWGITVAAMRNAFMKKNNGLPTMTTEDAIPEDYLRIDIVLDVRFTSIVETRGEEIDKARIREVDQALIKFKGLGYEDAVWEKVPTPGEGERWSDFVTAYDDWVMGRYVQCPKSGPLKRRLDSARAKPFEELERTKQADYITGGELMKYQLEGVTWLYYKWYQKKNAILADEMGLGKTIQIVAFLATLVHEHNCFPFLVVVPNSTCPNWRREIKRWAPSLRVVAYYGSAAARDAAYRYELFPEGSKELRCHVVVTSYDAAADENCRKFFRSVPWQGLFVDEGQRLKNDKNLLYDSLSNLKIPFRVLLTGTPLQNNARELFNLLQFLDESFDAAALELEYAELTKENVPLLHNLIRPFFLRRTKAQVLTFMPPMAQIILPVSMSVLQTKLYGSILAKNPDLLRAIFETNALKKSDRGSLNNMLMQLRKCLCHPFVYSQEIEERSEVATVSHRNLVEASGKLQLLETLLPKLQERGHRVLIFSQFLGMLDIMEDFLDGLGLAHRRLDGTIGALEKQKRIDEYNAPNSPLFAFLLSTRAGGVGINLATADTVIILDPDFNPHQDIQALSRAHRIGQKNKVLCFQLMTRASAEERIVQIGRRKMALDHVLIERMDADEDAGVDMESILRYGAAEILEGHTEELKYDDASIEKLLDRSQIEDTKAGEDNTAESQFSFARVWANDAASMVDSLGSDDEKEKAPDPTRWEYILKQREQMAAEEAAARQQVLGRGKRARKNIDYKGDGENLIEAIGKDSSSDTDFQIDNKSEAEESAEEKEHEQFEVAAEANRLVEGEKKIGYRGTLSQNDAFGSKPFVRAAINWSTTQQAPPPAEAQAQTAPDPATSTTEPSPAIVQCHICATYHRLGHCPLKLAGPEFCSLCGLAHYGYARTCPHIRSETQVGEMLAALKQSTESRQLVELAKKYLQGVRGTLVQAKKLKKEKAAQRMAVAQQIAAGGAIGPVVAGPSGQIVQKRPQVVGNGPSTNGNEFGSALRNMPAGHDATPTLQVRQFVPQPPKVPGQGQDIGSSGVGSWKNIETTPR